MQFSYLDPFFYGNTFTFMSSALTLTLKPCSTRGYKVLLSKFSIYVLKCYQLVLNINNFFLGQGGQHEVQLISICACPHSLNSIEGALRGTGL